MRSRDLSLTALSAGALVAVGMLMWPLFVFLPNSSLRALLVAPLYAVIANVLLLKVRFRGALVIFSLVIGFILSLFFPLMLPVHVVAGIAVEGIGFIAGLLSGHRPWHSWRPLRWLGIALFPALQFPLMLYALTTFAGGPHLGGPVVVLLTACGLLPGLAGCWLSELVWRRIQAGG